MLSSGAERANSARRRRGEPGLGLVAPARRGGPAKRSAGVTLRSRLRAALDRCASHESIAMALVLVERLSPAEAADALGMSRLDFDRAYRTALSRMRRVIASATRRGEAPVLRRAS